MKTKNSLASITDARFILNAKRFVFISAAIASYVAFNQVVSRSSEAMLGIINILASMGTLALFNREVSKRTDGRYTFIRPHIKFAIIGGFGILLIATGLRNAQPCMGGVNVTMPYVYVMFIVVNAISELIRLKKMSGVTSLFNLILHAGNVALMWWHLHYHWQKIINFKQGTIWVGLAVAGYWLFNTAVRVPKQEQKRSTNITMNFVGGTLLLLFSPLASGTVWRSGYLLTILVGSGAIVGIVAALGKAYSLFENREKYLVPIWVYDGLLFVQLLLNIVSLAILGQFQLIPLAMAVAGGACILYRSPYMQLQLFPCLRRYCH